MTALEVSPSGIDLLAIRVGSTLERWGRERALRRAPHHDPAEARRLQANVAVERARGESLLTRVR